MFPALPRLVLLALLAPLAACGSDGADDSEGDRGAGRPHRRAERSRGRGRRGVRRLRARRRPTCCSPAPRASWRRTRRATTTAPASLYAPTRMHWEAIEPVAETFGDLDPRTDAREADLAEGEEWAGWHLIEKDLWPAGAEAGYQPLSDAERTEYADRLLADLTDARGRGRRRRTTPGEQIANGAKELLDEVANGKVTGEEEFWSHTDLYDFQANVDGARKSFDVLDAGRRRDRPRARARP